MKKPYCVFYTDEKDFNYNEVEKFDSESPPIKMASAELMS